MEACLTRTWQTLVHKQQPMNDITLNLIVLLILSMVGAGIFLLVRRKQAEGEQKIIQLAASQGWEYGSIREPLAWGARLISPQWTLEAISRSSGKEAGPGSSDVVMSTTWHADTPGSTFFIGTRTSQANPNGISDLLTRQILQLALGSDAGGLDEIQIGSKSFRQQYMFRVQDPAEAEKILTPTLESALLAWKGQPLLIKRSSGGLTIELRGVRLKNSADILSLVRLGELFI
jgi:hypothetical protein